jgi:redox-sensitive bicupin YhaK (pirin superfamily)
MITVRRSEDRGHADRGWLQSHHTFTFGSYQDPNHMGFRALRVLNDDRIAAGKGFGPHAHRDMEIVTYVLEGELAHRDSMNERHTLGPNEIQTMSAGTGVVHSEFNASESEPVHLIQTWIEPAAEDLAPSYQQVAFPPEEKRGRLRLLAAPYGTEGNGVTFIHQDARHVCDTGRARRARRTSARRRSTRVGTSRARVDLAERHRAQRRRWGRRQRRRSRHDCGSGIGRRRSVAV